MTTSGKLETERRAKRKAAPLLPQVSAALLPVECINLAQPAAALPEETRDDSGWRTRARLTSDGTTRLYDSAPVRSALLVTEAARGLLV